MQQLLDTPGFAAVVVTLLGALATLILAVAGYMNVKTEQARQGERMIGLQRQMDQLPANGQLATPAPLPSAVPAPAAPPMATTVLTLPVDGTALHIEAVPRTTPAPAPASASPDQVPAEAPTGPSVTYSSGPPTP